MLALFLFCLLMCCTPMPDRIQGHPMLIRIYYLCHFVHRIHVETPVSENIFHKTLQMNASLICRVLWKRQYHHHPQILFIQQAVTTWLTPIWLARVAFHDYPVMLLSYFDGPQRFDLMHSCGHTLMTRGCYW